MGEQLTADYSTTANYELLLTEEHETEVINQFNEWQKDEGKTRPNLIL